VGAVDRTGNAGQESDSQGVLLLELRTGNNATRNAISELNLRA
jgi:hypothetical protein